MSQFFDFVRSLPRDDFRFPFRFDPRLWKTYYLRFLVLIVSHLAPLVGKSRRGACGFAQLRGHPWRHSGDIRADIDVFPPSTRENSPGRLAPRDRRLGKWTALLAGCLLPAGRPDGALREVRLAYLRDPNVDIANWGGKP
jgi:hypothetical protein